MRLNVSDITVEGVQQELKLPVAVNESAVPDIADVFIRLFRFGKKVLVEGSVKVSVSLACSRCLNEFSYPLDMSFREEYTPAEDIGAEGEQELTAGELGTGFYSNDRIDIPDIVKEQVLLSLPMKPLCKSECKGMCAGCGKDLNKGPCECGAGETDPRLAPLKKIRELINDRKE